MRKIMKLNKVNFAVAIIIPIIPITTMQFSIRSNINDFKKMAPFTEITGHVSKLNCANHGEYYVQYKNDNDNIELVNKAAHFLLNGECKSLHVDELVKVWVSERDINYVSFLSPDSALNYMRSEATSLLRTYPLFVIFIFLFTQFRNHKVFDKRKNT
jgi:hypothetical protein